MKRQLKKLLRSSKLYIKINKTDLRPFNKFKQRALQYLFKDYPKEVQKYYNIFKKPIWVTEWNLQISKTTGNTLFQALFVAQYLLECMSSKALNVIELSTYHNLGGRDIAGSIFRNNNDYWEQIGGDIDGQQTSNGGFGLRFGKTVSLSDDGSVVAIGGCGWDDGNGYTHGEVRVYENTNGIWEQVGSIIPFQNAR